MTDSTISDERLAEMLAAAREQVRLIEARIAKSAIPEDGWNYADALAEAYLKTVLLTELIALRARSRNDVVRGEPAAWVVLLDYGNGRWSNEMLTDILPSNDPSRYKIVRPLYAHPPTPSEPTGPHPVTVEQLLNGQSLVLPHTAEHAQHLYAVALASMKSFGLIHDEPTEQEVEAAAKAHHFSQYESPDDAETEWNWPGAQEYAIKNMRAALIAASKARGG